MPLEFTETGLQTQGLAEIISEVNTSLIDKLGLDVPPEPDEVLGVLNGILSEREALAQFNLQAVNSSFDARFATGTSLDRVANYTATKRKPATNSKSTSFLARGTPATAIIDDSRFQLLQTTDVWAVVDGPFVIVAGGAAIFSVTDSLGIAKFNFTPGPTLFVGQTVDISTFVTNTAYNVTGDITATGAGFFQISSIAFGTNETGLFEENSIAVTAQAEETGPVSFLNTGVSSWAIITNIAGWDDIRSTADLDPEDTGSDVENDPDFRIRRRDSLLKDGNDLEAIRVSVLDVVGVTSTEVFENTDCTQTVDGIPPGEFEVVVDGGLDADIAAAIFDDKPPGAIGAGSTSVDVTTSTGQTVAIKFSRPTDVDIDVQITVGTAAAEFPFPANGSELIAAAFLAAGNAVATISRDQIPESFIGVVFDAVKTDLGQDTISSALVEMRVGIDPFDTIPIPIDLRERGDYDSSTISVIIL